MELLADPSLPLLGWREWAALPDLGLEPMLAKVDTGARSCALHVDWQHCFIEAGVERVEFLLTPMRALAPVRAVAKVLDRRPVTDSGGRTAERVFIRTRLRLGAWMREVEVNLADRRGLRHAMLIGRSAIAAQWCVDPARSFVLGGAQDEPG